MTRSQRLWLSLPPTTLCGVDALLTLWGQPAAYWNGDLQSVLEFNPLGHVLLAYHPLAFLLGVVVVATIYCLLILSLPGRWATLVALAAAIGHTFGGAAWLLRAGPLGWLGMIAFLLAAERLVRLSLPPRSDPAPGNVPG